jgi:DNA-binding transcriptional regulator YiaG
MDQQTAATLEKLAQLKRVRRRLGWSEETCAHELGVTYSTLNRWERGESLPKSRAVVKAIDDFLTRYGTPPNAT